MTMEKQPFEDVFPIKSNEFPCRFVSLLEGTFYLKIIFKMGPY